MIPTFVQVDPLLKAYIGLLTSHYKEISEVWLFGSRANGSAKIGSDWDLFVFCEKNVFTSLQLKKQPSDNIIDLFILIDGEVFRNPRPDKAGVKYKKIKLSDLKWKVIGVGVAEYDETKWVEGKAAVESGYDKNGMVTQRRNAYRIWP